MKSFFSGCNGTFKGDITIVYNIIIARINSAVLAILVPCSPVTKNSCISANNIIPMISSKFATLVH